MNRPRNSAVGAAWITLPGEKAENVTFLARREFELDDVPVTRVVRIAADCRYVLHINGEKAGAGPAKGSHKRYFYDSHEVAPRLKKGINRIAVEVHSPGRPTFSAVPAVPALWVEVEGLFGTDGAWQVRSDPSRPGGAPIYAPQLGFSEWCDLRRERVGWTSFADGMDGWEAAEVVGEAPGNRGLAPRDVPELTGEWHRPARIVSCGRIAGEGEPADDEASYAERMQAEGHAEDLGAAVLAGEDLRLEGDSYVILDFERENFGNVEIGIEAPEGAILDVGYGDALYEGRIKTFQKTHQDSYRFADRYILRGGRLRIDHALHDRGFRFLQLVLRRAPLPAAISVRVRDRTYPMPVRASFVCDDPFLNRLWDMCGATLAACVNDTFVDCPWREQAFWVCDTLVVFPYYLSFTGDGVLPARCLRLAADGQRESGLIPSVYPSAEVKDSTFPSCAAIWVLMLGEYHLHVGDKALALVGELLPTLERALALYEGWAGPDGLVPNQPGMWNFIEWGSPGSLPGAEDRGATAILNLLIAAAFQSAASLYAAVGETAKAERCRERQRAWSAAVAARFWVPEAGRFRDATRGGESVSQHPHAVALHYGLLDDSMRESALEALGDPAVVKADFYYQHYVLTALARGGRGAEALAVVRELWGEMVVQGSPTVWETRKGKDDAGGVGSLCHAFACAPLAFMQAALLGVRPLRPGFAEFALEPQSLGLRFCRGTVPTPRGSISVAWSQGTGGSLRVEVEVPPASVAVLPSGIRLDPGRHVFTSLPSPL